jgi:hypothetical protein
MTFIPLLLSDITHILMLDWITSLRTHRMNQPQLSKFSSFMILNAIEEVYSLYRIRTPSIFYLYNGPIRTQRQLYNRS